MKIVLAIATASRPKIVEETLARFAAQSCGLERVIVVGSAAEDAPSRLYGAQFHISPVRGSSHQRNFALDLVGQDADIMVFVDDDFVPALGFISGVARLFSGHPEVVAASGHLIADGVRSKGLSFAEADALIANHPPPAQDWLVDANGAYGCNMAFRLASSPQTRFDENLPLYAWLEDTDFSAFYARVGRVVRASHFAGVHLGVKSGRTSGARLGYSQIANAAYLVRKGTLRRSFAIRLALGNLISNCLKSFAPEPWIDRRGRLQGNMLALSDLLRGSLSPGRILDL